MPKRFTDTDKWKKQWFRKLTPKMKLFWDYVTTNCDYCGIWDIDFEMASFAIGQKYLEEDVMIAFEGKLQQIDEDKLFITSFIHFQYGPKPGVSKQHQSVNRRLEQYGINWEGLGGVGRIEPTIPRKVGESKPEASTKAQELLQKAKEVKDQINKVRAVYPLNNGGEPANKAISKAIKDDGFDKVLLGAKNYALKTAGTEPKWIKSTARFFTEQVYLDFQGDNPKALFDNDSDNYKLSAYFYEGVKHWTSGIMATEAEIQAGAVHIQEMLARDEVTVNTVLELCRWIDKHEDRKSGFSWRTALRTTKDLKERFLRNEFHEFTKSYQGVKV